MNHFLLWNDHKSIYEDTAVQVDHAILKHLPGLRTVEPVKSSKDGLIHSNRFFLVRNDARLHHLGGPRAGSS